MNEKRFTLFGLDNETIKDDVTKECYWVNEYVQRKKLVDLLNEQQATISTLKEENIELKKLKKYCAEWIGVNEDNLYDVVR